MTMDDRTRLIALKIMKEISDWRTKELQDEEGIKELMKDAKTWELTSLLFDLVVLSALLRNVESFLEDADKRMDDRSEKLASLLKMILDKKECEGKE